MKSAAIIGYTGKGSFNKPIQIDNVKELHTNFGKKFNTISVAEQLIYADYSPVVVRLEEDTFTATSYILDDNNTICMTISADSPGTTGSFTSVEVTRTDGRFNLLVSNSGEMVEFWGNLKPNEAEDIVNLASKWITINVLTKVLPIECKFNLKLDRKIQPIPMSKITDEVLTAIKATENYDIEFIALPTCNSEEIINEVLAYLEDNRPEIMLVIDPPWECDLLQTYKWCKNLLPSDQGIIFWPWLNYEGKSIPPSGPILTALLGWPFVWKPIRSNLVGISETSFNIHNDELVYLSKQDHFINLIIKKQDLFTLEPRVITIGGNKLSERRLLNHIKNEISKIGKELLRSHNPISNSFRNKFIESSEYILGLVKDDHGINNFMIQINELCNPKDFEVNVDLVMKDSENVNICFKFTQADNK